MVGSGRGISGTSELCRGLGEREDSRSRDGVRDGMGVAGGEAPRELGCDAPRRDREVLRDRDEFRERTGERSSGPGDALSRPDPCGVCARDDVCPRLDALDTPS